MGRAELTNWAGNITFAPRAFHRPTSVPQLQALVAASDRVRVLGTGHSFNAIAETPGDLITVAELPARLELDERHRQVTVSAGTRFGVLARGIHESGWALHNLGSLPHISVAGAVSTGTHGSGNTNGNLASALSGIEFVSASGELVALRRGERGFDGAVVTLGTIGVLTALTFDVQPGYEVEQRVYDDVPVSALRSDLGAVLASAYSVSVFLTLREPLLGQVWVRHRTDAGAWAQGSSWLGGRLADGARHPVPGMNPDSCTQQGGVPGPWHERLPCFRLEFTPSAGEELQTEYLLPLQHAAPALQALLELADRIAPVLMIAELRTVAADELWLSEAYRQDSIAVHFTWVQDLAAVAPVVRELEDRLVPLGARAHWGKVFGVGPEQIAAAYPRLPEARELIAGFDPTGKFRNDFVEAYLFGA